jgi:hypothetical protein
LNIKIIVNKKIDERRKYKKQTCTIVPIGSDDNPGKEVGEVIDIDRGSP